MIGSSDVNAFLQDIIGEDFTANDFRTWGGTVLALKTLMAIGPSQNAADGKRNVNQCIKQVAARLGNTIAVCRKNYIYPSLFECYL